MSRYFNFTVQLPPLGVGEQIRADEKSQGGTQDQYPDIGNP
jgi:hypothetical protein